MAMKPSRRAIPVVVSIEAQILEQLAEVKSKVDESLRVGMENGSELRSLRRELGLDGAHGRLPVVEADLIRHAAQMSRIEARLEKLEEGNSEAKGKAKLVATVLALAGGGAGGALISLIAHWMH